MLDLFQQEYGQALETRIFEATQVLPDLPPAKLEAYEDGYCSERASLFQPQAFRTEEHYTSFRAHIDRERARFAVRAQAAAQKAAWLERDQERTGRRGATHGQGPGPAPRPSRGELALAMARNLDKLCQSFHRLLLGVRTVDLTDQAAIHKLDQAALKPFLAATHMLGRETEDNDALTRALDLLRGVEPSGDPAAARPGPFRRATGG
jgi:hypothetical protein